jgi:predicted nucleic acid-binding protein
VLDASVAAKWFLPGEELEEKARALLADAQRRAEMFYAPDVVWAEVASAIANGTLGRSARLTEMEAEHGIDDWLLTDIEITESRTLLPAAFRLTRQHGIALYDALYVALAQQLGVPLITADGRLHARLSYLPGVRWLGSYSAGSA